MLDLHVFSRFHQFKSKATHLRCVSFKRYWQTADHHVRVTDCFNFVDVIAVNRLVKYPEKYRVKMKRCLQVVGSIAFRLSSSQQQQPSAWNTEIARSVFQWYFTVNFFMALALCVIQTLRVHSPV
jgi:hypothetical protein